MGKYLSDIQLEQQIRNRKEKKNQTFFKWRWTSTHWIADCWALHSNKKKPQKTKHTHLYFSHLKIFFFFPHCMKKTIHVLKEKETFGFVWNENCASGRGLAVKARDTKGQTQKSHNALTGERDPVLSSSMRPGFKSLFHLTFFEFPSFFS